VERETGNALSPLSTSGCPEVEREAGKRVLRVERETDNALLSLSTVRLPSPELLSTSGCPEVERETDNALLSLSTAGPVWHRRPNTHAPHCK
jgi:hypothetical protein